MEEFGELDINIEEIEGDGTIEVTEHTTCLKKVVGNLDSDWFGVEEISEKVMPIGMLYSYEFKLYISESGKIFSATGWEGDSIWEAWDNIISKNGSLDWSDYLKYHGIINGMEVEVSEEIMKILEERGGWYEGRKIDITEKVKFLEERGFEVFESAKNFMEEFGELKIWGYRFGKGTRKVSECSTFMEDVVGDLDSSHFGLEEYISDKVIPIGKIDDVVVLYISESGRIYSSRGWEGEHAWKAFENFIYKKGPILWSDFKEK